MPKKGTQPQQLRKDTVHLADVVIALMEGAILVVTPNSSVEGYDPSGSESPLTKLQFVEDSIDSGDWFSPQGAVANIKYAAEGAADNLLSLEGIVLTGLAYGAHYGIKHKTNLNRRILLETRKHRFSLGA